MTRSLPPDRPARPAAAAADTDAESANEGELGPERSLRALQVMRDRGLISREEFERRRQALATTPRQ